ncbi:MAG: hypothetical protein HRU20_03365 [Pseudomonadales bacterium]|nr:hypothetical protein [Pseudomonadales bacterium]
MLGFKRRLISVAALPPKRLKLLRLIFLPFILSLLSFSPAYAAGDMAIFSMNKELNPISKAKARMIFLGKIKTLKPVGTIVLMDWPAKSLQRQNFYRQLLNKTPEQVNNKWASLAFSGRGRPPTAMADSSVASLQQWLDKHPQGLAYAPVADVPGDANILLVVK